MKSKIASMLVLLFVLTFSATSFAFYEHGEINKYLSYDRLIVMTPDRDNVVHPKVKGRLINVTNEKVYVLVHVYFCDIFKTRHNHVTLSISMRPKEKVEFEKYLKASEYERTRNAHHVEFHFEKLIVGGNVIRVKSLDLN